ncbi:MAG: glycerophosphodiester phosphodiesterase family protein [Bacteroidota bacterium]|nr:glycerophosphodiester phosphodiesterase family protein [Bacteroidota bacterium]
MKQRIQLSIAMVILMVCAQSFAGVKNIAHRGGAMLAPENTLAAFNNAVALKADYLELDILISSDDSLMIMHDNTVDRTTNGTGSVSSMTYAQLRVLDAGSKFNISFASEKIPTFSEVLEVAKNSPNNIGIVAEVKSTDPTAVQKSVAMIQKYGMQSRVILSSFNINQITSAKTLDPTIRVQLFATASNAIIDQVKAINGEWIGSSLGTQPLIDYAHSKGVLFNIWTINGASQMTSYIALGVDGITTDDPKTLKSLSDTTAPGDVTLISAIVNETQITLSWNAATDSGSGIAGYEIYRGTASLPTALYAKVGNVTQYIDQTLTENATYYYRVKAKSNAQILSANYSNELSATALADVIKPSVLFVTSHGDTGTVVVEFSERIDSATASTKTNYTINNSIVVLNAQLALDKKSVILTTTKMNDLSYTLNVKNVKDKAIVSNVMVTSNNIFAHISITANVVSHYTLDNITMQGSDTVIFDATANANTGILKNGPVLSDGLLGNGLQFDGIDDYVQFTPSTSFDIGGSAVSVSVWTKLNYLPADLPGAFGPLFDSETDNYVLYEDKGNNQLRFKATTSGGAARPGISAADLKTGEWINVVGVYDGANAMIYLNGVLKGTLPLTGTVNAGQSATLGKSGTSYFSGKLDNVFVFNKALSQTEITDMVTNIKTAPLLPDGTVSVIKESSPKEFSLSQNYPNPFNPTTNITFGVPQNRVVKIMVYDVLGREVATLVNENYAPGFYTIPFNAGKFASGVYIYRMISQPSSGDQKLVTYTKKLLLMK